MQTASLCKDGLSIQVNQQGESKQVQLSFAKDEGPVLGSFMCHLDDLLVASKGLSFQAGNQRTHILIRQGNRGLDIEYKAGDAKGRCTVSNEEFEAALQTLRTPR